MPEKPTILVFSTAYAPFIGGAELAVHEIARRLSNDFKFIIITARLKKLLPRFEQIDNCTIIRLGIGSVLDKIFLPFFGFFSARKIINKNPKILMWGVMISYASIAAYFVKLFYKNVPFVLTAQEGDNEWKKFPSRLWWRIIPRKVDHVTSISNFLKDRVVEAGYRGRISIVPNGVDDSFLKITKHNNEQNIVKADFDRNQSSQLIIFSASRLVYKNGIDLLLDAASILKDKFNFRVVLAGDGEEYEKLKTKSKILGIEDRVEFLMDVPYKKLPDYYVKADIFVRPSRSEGLGSAFLEAMAAGLITIGTPVGGIPDFLEDGKNGLLARRDDAEDLARVLQKAFKMNNGERIAMIEQARTTVRGYFLWSDVAEKMKQIFYANIDKIN